MEWQTRISFDAKVCHGQACIKGTRVMVSLVMDNLAAREPASAIATAHRISAEDIEATLHYAAELAKGQVIPLSAGVA